MKGVVIMATAEQIKQEIRDWNSSKEEISQYFESAWVNFLGEIEWRPEGVQLPSGGAFFVRSFGGEGRGEEYWVIFKIGEELFKVDGYYSSWDGINWDEAELYKVVPVEVIVTQYQKIDD